MMRTEYIMANTSHPAAMRKSAATRTSIDEEESMPRYCGEYVGEGVGGYGGVVAFDEGRVEDLPNSDDALLILWIEAV